MLNQPGTSKAAPSGVTITGISPTSGPQTGGTQVIIEGTGFVKTITWKQVSAGTYQTCGVATDEEIYCWGTVSRDGTGGGMTATSPTKVTRGEIPAGVTIQKLSAGDNHVCVLASDKNVYCWGDNSYGQLGNATTIVSNTPVLVAKGSIPAGAVINDIGTHFGITCAITGSDGVYCWGNNNNGQLGDGTRNNSSTPVSVLAGDIPIGTSFKSIGVGGGGTCVVATNDAIYCWGGDVSGYSSSPVLIQTGALPVGSSVLQISVGSVACVIANNNQAYCWGYNGYGQLGDGTTVSSASPVAVSQGERPLGSTVQRVDVGSYGACLAVGDGRAYCWGNQNGTGVNSLIPLAIAQGAMPAGTVVSDVTSSYWHSCVLAGGDIYCFGDTELGDGTYNHSYTPVKVIDTFNTIQSVTFGGVSSTGFGVLSATQLYASTPAHSFGTVPVAITDNDGHVTTYNSYTYKDSTPPVIAFTNGSSWYDVIIAKGDTFDPRAQIQSVTDDVDGVMDINAVEISSTQLLVQISMATIK